MTEEAKLVERLRGVNMDRVTPVDALRLHDQDSATFPLSAEDVEGVLALIDEAADTIERLSRERDEALRYATGLLASFVHEHCDPVPEWKPLPDLLGVLTQLDNATTVTRDIKAERDAEREACAQIAESFHVEKHEPSRYVPGDDDETLGYFVPPTTRTSGPLPKRIAAAIRARSDALRGKEQGR